MTVALFYCGAPVCHDGQPHDTAGPDVEWTAPCAHCDGDGFTPLSSAETGTGFARLVPCRRCRGTGEGCSGGSLTCSRCGVTAFDRSLWEGE